jgi:hypothetical protein
MVPPELLKIRWIGLTRSLQHLYPLLQYGLKQECISLRVRFTPPRREYIPVGLMPASQMAMVGLKPDTLQEDTLLQLEVDSTFNIYYCIVSDWQLTKI